MGSKFKSSPNAECSKLTRSDWVRLEAKYTFDSEKGGMVVEKISEKS